MILSVLNISDLLGFQNRYDVFQVIPVRMYFRTQIAHSDSNLAYLKRGL